MQEKSQAAQADNAVAGTSALSRDTLSHSALSRSALSRSALSRSALSRRDFLRGLGGGALALGGAGWLAGCGGGGGNAAPAPNVPFTMFLSTFLARSVLRYQSATGRLTELIRFPEVSDQGKKPQSTAGLVVSPNKQNLFVFSPGSDQIFMVDTNTGALKRTIRGSFVNTAHDGTIGPDGRLYFVNAPSLNAAVGTSRPDSIEILDPTTGDHLGTFIDTNTTPEVRGPFGLQFGPDGDLYVSTVLSFGFNPATFPFRPDTVVRFDGATGRFKNFVVRAQHLAFTMTFHPNGQLLLPSFFFNRVYNYDTTTGTLRDAFANVQFPIQVLYGPDGDLYVSSFADQAHLDLLIDRVDLNDENAQGAGRILRFNGRTGQERPVVLSNLPFGAFLAFL